MVEAVLRFLKDAPNRVWALLYVLILLLLTFFSVDVGKHAITPYPYPVYPLLAVGLLALVGVSLVTLAPQLSRASAIGGQIAITSTNESVETSIGQNVLRVQLGRLETSASDPSCSLIILPANEYFDDECITDVKSALGSFVQSKLPGRTAEFEREVGEQLATKSSTQVVVGGNAKPSYGLGTAIYLDHPLKESLNLLLVAATTQRPGEGLRGDVTALFTIAREAIAVARDKRLSDIFQPLIGAGHGGIKPTRALLAQMIAWSELLFASPGQKVTISIVLLPPTDKHKASISLTQARDLLRTAVGVCQPEESR
jgi:antiphage defense system Thoeris ThsA-like protein